MTEQRPPTRAEALRDVVRGRVEGLQSAYQRDDATATATLARLRRCDPAEPGSEPGVWAITIGDLPEPLTDLRSDGPTPFERAAHAAIVLYAIHQQGHRADAVHRRGVRLGSAVGQLARARARAQGEDLDRSVVQRFHQVALANDVAARLQYLRGLVLLMRSENGLAIDYGLLSADLGRLADPRADHAAVLTRWGRDLHFKPAPTTTTTEETK